MIEKDIQIVDVYGVPRVALAIEGDGVLVDDLPHQGTDCLQIRPADGRFGIEPALVEKVLPVEVAVELVPMQAKALQCRQGANLLAVGMDGLKGYRRFPFEHLMPCRKVGAPQFLLHGEPSAVVFNKSQEVEEAPLAVFVEELVRP